LTISLYPEPALNAETIKWIESQAARHNVRLNWKRQDVFVRMDRSSPRADADYTRAIYTDCWLRRRCHLVKDGRFYTCTRPSHFHTLLGGFLDDGVPLHPGPEMVNELLAYLNREHPLEACARCEGGHAPVAPHRQMSVVETQTLRRSWTP